MKEPQGGRRLQIRIKASIAEEGLAKLGRLETRFDFLNDPCGQRPVLDSGDHILADTEVCDRIGLGEQLAVRLVTTHGYGIECLIQPSVAKWECFMAGKLPTKARDSEGSSQQI